MVIMLDESNIDQGITLGYHKLNDTRFILNLICTRQITFQIIERFWDDQSKIFNVTALSAAGNLFMKM